MVHESYKTLGLEPGTAWETVKKMHKLLSFELHPDLNDRLKGLNGPLIAVSQMHAPHPPGSGQQHGLLQTRHELTTGPRLR